MSREEGFTIVEAVVALVIIFGAVLVMLRGIDSGAKTLVETKRQSAASALASELMERARSLEWDNMGLTVNANSTNCTEPSSPSDSPQGVGCSIFSSEFPGEITSITGGYAFGGEPVVFATGGTFDPFLSFHQQVTRDSTVFDRYLFITSVRTDPGDAATEKYRRITAIVRWTAPSGYRREVRLTSYVSPYTEPSQPFVSSEIAFEGGFAQVSGRLTGISGWGQANDPTTDEAVLVSMPSMRVTSTSDYVSFAEDRFEGASAYWTQAGADGVIGSTSTDDVKVAVVDPEVVDLLADDDGTSGAPLEDQLTADVNLVSLGAANDGTLIEESANASVKDHSAVEIPGGAVAVDGTDGLPNAEMEASGAGWTTISRTENWAGVPELAYDDAAYPLSATEYTFTFYRYGDHAQTEAFSWTGTADREDDASTGLRKATASFVWDGEEFDLLDDDVVDAPSFRGWVVVTLPKITNEGSYAPLEAGEYYAALTPDIGVDKGDVTIDVWNGSGYTRVFEDYQGIANCGAESYDIDEDHQVAETGRPHLHYIVTGSLTVNGMCVGTTEQYGSGEIRSNTVAAASVVVGDLRYRVYDDVAYDGYVSDPHNPDPDEEARATLYDVTVSFSAGGVQATAVYINPELP